MRGSVGVIGSRAGRVPLPLGGLVLLSGLAFAGVAQGGFYGDERRTALGLIALAAVAMLLVRRPAVRHLGVPVVACAALAGSALVSGAAAGSVDRAVPTVGLLAGLALVTVLVRLLDDGERDALVAGLLVIGAVVALVGWVGVAFRVAPLALVDGGLWRSASTITYANGTAGLLAPVALVGLARLLAGRGARLPVYLLLVGLGATLSRGGLAAFLAGLVVLLIVSPDRGRAVVRVGPPAVGALVALAALAPSFPADASVRPALACAGLVLGAVVAAVTPRDRTVLAVTGALAAALVVVAATTGAVAGRVTLSSPDRADEQRATIALARERPVFGVGPGNFGLSYVSHLGVPATAEFAHNEYLQLLAEQGLLGLAALGAAGAALTVALLRARRRVDGVLWAGAAAALTALAVHSATDFLWRMPVIPMVGAVLVGLALPADRSDRQRGGNQ